MIKKFEIIISKVTKYQSLASLHKSWRIHYFPSFDIKSLVLPMIYNFNHTISSTSKRPRASPQGKFDFYFKVTSLNMSE